MYNQKLIKATKGLLIGAGAIFCILLGHSVAQVQQHFTHNGQKQVQVKQKKEEKKQASLSEKQVKDFLIAYYTKKDLEENRPRYKPFMTESMYQEAIRHIKAMSSIRLSNLPLSILMSSTRWLWLKYSTLVQL